MKARPILFSGPMVRALLDGRKTQTRRVINPQPEVDSGSDAICCPDWWLEWKGGEGHTPQELARLCPYGQAGDLIWVREHIWQTCRLVNDSHPESGCSDFKTVWSSGSAYPADGGICPEGMGSRPSIHMPRWASRLTLEITGVRVERLQDISRRDAMDEGIVPYKDYAGNTLGWCATSEGGWYAEPVNAYDDLWESINGPGSWDANPWVWVLEFTVHSRNVDELLKTRAA